MKFHLLCFAALAACSLFVGQTSADIVIQDAATNTNVLLGDPAQEGPQGSASSQGAFGFNDTDAAGTDGTRGRGQSFLFSTAAGPAGATYDIDTLAVSLNASAGNAIRPAGNLIATVFEWQGSDADDFTVWGASDGAEFASGHTELFTDTLAIPAATALNNGQVVELAFNPGELQFTDGVNYGLFFRYVLDNVDGLDTADVTIAFDTRQDNALEGALLNTGAATSFAAAANGQSTSRDFNLSITGTAAVPEPSSLAVLVFGAVGFVIRRRR